MIDALSRKIKFWRCLPFPCEESDGIHKISWCRRLNYFVDVYYSLKINIFRHLKLKMKNTDPQPFSSIVNVIETLLAMFCFVLATSCKLCNH